MGKSTGRKVIDVFGRTQKDVRYKMERATAYKDYVIKKIKAVDRDPFGNKRYAVTLHKRKKK